MNETPQGDTGAIGRFPQDGQYLLVLCLLLGVVFNVYIQFGDEHGHLQGILLLFQHALQFGVTDAAQFVRLVAVGVDRGTGIAQSLHQIDVFVNVISDRVVVVVNQNGIRPTLMGHVEGLDEPVVARLAATAQRLLHHGVAILVHAHSLVHHVDHGQCVELGLCMVEPVGDCCKTLVWRQVRQPAGILCAPHQRMEFMGKVVLLGIVEGILCSSPVEDAAISFYRSPLRFVLTGNLVPKRIVSRNFAACLHIASGGDVAQELVGIARQLGA